MTKKNKILNMEDRERILKNIGLALKKEFGKNILSFMVYGSALSEDFCSRSDFDLLLVFRKINSKDIEKLRKIRLDFLKKKIILDVNVHIFNELPEIRKKEFWHRNRSFFIQKDLELYGRLIMGKNFFQKASFTKKEIKLEAVRMINSYLYQAREILINANIDHEQKSRIMKFCVYAVLVALAFLGKYPKTRKEAFDLFYPLLKTKINPVCFFNKKTKSTDNISISDLNKALEFLSELDEKIYALYKQD